jgi:hypothetical protein
LSTKIPHHYSFEKPVQVQDAVLLLLLGGGTAALSLLGHAERVEKDRAKRQDSESEAMAEK